MTRISVVIPTYGRPRFLAEAIESVLNQTVEPHECIVVDDASPQRVTVPDDPRVRLVRRASNGGAGAARNTGVAHATGDVVCFLDDDDLYTPERLELAAEGVERASVAVCWSRWLGGRANPQRRLEGDVHASIATTITPHLGVTAVRREALHPFDERFRTVQDVDWWIRTTASHLVTTSPRVGCLVRRHRGERNRSGADQRVRDSQLLLEVHRDYFDVYPRARAFRLRRIGLMAYKSGDPARARSAFLRAVASGDLRSAKHLIHPPRRYEDDREGSSETRSSSTWGETP